MRVESSPSRHEVCPDKILSQRVTNYITRPIKDFGLEYTRLAFTIFETILAHQPRGILGRSFSSLLYLDLFYISPELFTNILT